jgi:hypothetical protein
LIKGIHLTLLIGVGKPKPLSQEALNALTNVRITSASGNASGFQLSFSISTNSPSQTIFWFATRSLLPLMRVILVVTINGRPHVLIDGVITNVEVSPGTEKSHTTLSVTGSDLTAVMNYIDFSGLLYPAMPMEARVLLILSKYALLGIEPIVIPSILLDVPNPLEEIPRHEGTDLDYIKALADRVGYVFYLEPGPSVGSSIAYWGPEIKIGDPQPALNVNMDAFTNVKALTFSLDAEKKVVPIVMIHEPITKAIIPIPVPDFTPLSPPLGLLPPVPKKIAFMYEAAHLNAIRAAIIGMTKAARSADAVSASGSLDVLRYGRILNARQLVNVRGAGEAFDGLYYVTEVTHNIKPGEYTEDFKLSRNGLVSILDVLPI